MLENAATFSSFSVDDLQRAKDFYNGVLKLAARETPEGLALQYPGGGRTFIYSKKNHEPATFTVLNFVVDNVDAAVKELKSRGVRFEIYDGPDVKTDEQGVARGNGPTIAWFKDPAGNILSVVEEMKNRS